MLGRRAYVMRMVEGQPWRFREDFPAWLAMNFTIWEKFEAQANLVYGNGRRHYGARRIGEWLRHETAAKEQPEADWKLNDHVWPDLARTYLMLYPERQGFFELRESPQRKDAA